MASRYLDSNGVPVTVELHADDHVAVGVNSKETAPKNAVAPNPVHKCVATILGVNTTMSHGDAVVLKNGVKSVVSSFGTAGYTKL